MDAYMDPGMDNLLEKSHELHSTSLPDDLERQQQGQSVKLHASTLDVPRSTGFLDGLRGLAALCVFIQHFIGPFYANIHEHGFGENGHYHFASFPFLRVFFSGGNSAVAVFFVLSGYVLSKSPLRLLRDGNRRACGISLVSAVVRRPIRLYGPTLAVSFALAVLMHAPGGLLGIFPWPAPEESLFAELKTWTTLSTKFFNPFRSHGSMSAWYRYSLVMWTIPIELKGSQLIYTLTAIYAFSGLSLSLSLLLLGISVLVLLQLGHWMMACFIAGFILAFLDTYSLDTRYLSRRLAQRAQSALPHLAFFTGYYLLCQPVYGADPQYSLDTPGWHYLTLLIPSIYADQYYRYWHSWGATLLVYSALRIPWLQRFFNSRPLRYLGKISFMLYLVHLVILVAVGGRVNRMLGIVYAGAEPSWWDNLLYIPDIGPVGVSSRFLVSLAVVLPVCMAVADFATRWLDTPCVRAGKKVAQKLGLENGGVVDARNEAGLPMHSLDAQVVPLEAR